MFRGSHVLRRTVLQRCMARLYRPSPHPLVLTFDDFFKVCSLIAGSEDVLSLRHDPRFVQGLRMRFEELDLSAAAPFQKSVIEIALASCGAETVANDGTAHEIREQLDRSRAAVNDTLRAEAAALSGPSKSLETVDVVDSVLSSLWEVVRTVEQDNGFMGSTDAAAVRNRCDSLTPLVGQLKVSQILSLTDALVKIHYADYNFVASIARRCCDIASRFDARAATRAIYNLSRLNCKDSVTPLVLKVEAGVADLDLVALSRILQAIERYANTSAVVARLVPKLLAQLVVRMGSSSSSNVPHGATSPSCATSEQTSGEDDVVHFHKGALTVAAKYGLSRHPAVLRVVEDVQRLSRASKIDGREALGILSTVTQMGLGPAVVSGTARALVPLVERDVAQIEVHLLPNLLDALSTLQADTTSIMDQILRRLEVDSGKLTPASLVSVTEIVASYPPAVRHPCMASLAFSCAMLRDSLDADQLERVILSFVQARQFSDDFFDLCAFSLESRHGVVKSSESLLQLLQLLDAEAAADARVVRLATLSTISAAAVLSQEDIQRIRGEFSRLKIDDANLQHKLITRMRQLQREAGNRKHKRHYDPVDDL